MDLGQNGFFDLKKRLFNMTWTDAIILLLILRILWVMVDGWGDKGKGGEVGRERGVGESDGGGRGEEKKSWGSMFGELFKGGEDGVKAETGIDTRFSDVLGIDEFKEELEELVGEAFFFNWEDYLKNPEKYTRAGATIPKGLLLTGAPGTGKTLMARALAGEANCSFFYKSGAEFEEIYVGVGAKRVRELFDKARKSAPSIIFIDEIDALAGQRNPMQNSTVRGTINQILGEMDGFRQTDNIIVIGATNLEKSIDKAILRPGRFDKVINVPYPDMEGRRKILEYY